MLYSMVLKLQKRFQLIPIDHLKIISKPEWKSPYFFYRLNSLAVHMDELQIDCGIDINKKILYKDLNFRLQSI